MTATAERTRLQTTRRAAAQLRVDSIRMTTAAGSGHPTSSMSAADIMAVLITRHLRAAWCRVTGKLRLADWKQWVSARHASGRVVTSGR